MAMCVVCCWIMKCWDVHGCPSFGQARICMGHGTGMNRIGWISWSSWLRLVPCFTTCLRAFAEVGLMELPKNRPILANASQYPPKVLAENVCENGSCTIPHHSIWFLSDLRWSQWVSLGPEWARHGQTSRLILGMSAWLRWTQCLSSTFPHFSPVAA